MFIDIHEYPFLRALVDMAPMLAREFSEAGSERFVKDFLANESPPLTSHTEHWISENGLASSQTGYDSRDGAWASLPIFKKGFPLQKYNVEKHFPLALTAASKVPMVNFVSYFRIAPGAGTRSHSHSRSNLIFHLCLSDVGGESVLECNGVEKVFTRIGDNCLFDYSLPHSSLNRGKNDRINLVIDFTPELRP